MNEPDAKHEYRDEFFAYINAGSLSSASVICPLVCDWLQPQSLLDVGCGAGAWCKIWARTGVPEVVGVDGDYVQTESLLIPEETFHRYDLSAGFDLDRKFDLVTSLEVAEHLPAEAASRFVETLTRHGDRVLFSAATPGQGGEFHVNEQPLSYWRDKFFAKGYSCYDPFAPEVRRDARIEPWYRYNTLLYVKDEAASSLPRDILERKIGPKDQIPDFAPLSWRARNRVVRSLPGFVVKGLVQAKHAWMRAVRGGVLL